MAVPGVPRSSTGGWAAAECARISALKEQALRTDTLEDGVLFERDTSKHKDSPDPAHLHDERDRVPERPLPARGPCLRHAASVPTAYSAVVIPASARAKMTLERMVSERLIESLCYSMRSEGTLKPGQSRPEAHRGPPAQQHLGFSVHLWTAGRTHSPVWTTTALLQEPLPAAGLWQALEAGSLVRG
jgi:hypothetical protein